MSITCARYTSFLSGYWTSKQIVFVANLFSYLFGLNNKSNNIYVSDKVSLIKARLACLFHLTMSSTFNRIKRKQKGES